MRLREYLSCIITLSDRAELRAFEYRTHKLQLLLRRLRFMRRLRFRWRRSIMAFICNDSHVFNASAIFLRGGMPALEAQHIRRVKRGQSCPWRQAGATLAQGLLLRAAQGCHTWLKRWSMPLRSWSVRLAAAALCACIRCTCMFVPG